MNRGKRKETRILMKVKQTGKKLS